MKKIIFVFIILIILLGILYIKKENSSQLILDRLKSLPYLEYSEEKQNTNISGVTRYNKELAYDRYTIIDEEYIIDIKGNLLVALPGTGNLKILFDDGSVIDGAWGPNIGI